MRMSRSQVVVRTAPAIRSNAFPSGPSIACVLMSRFPRKMSAAVPVARISTPRKFSFKSRSRADDCLNTITVAATKPRSSKVSDQSQKKIQSAETTNATTAFGTLTTSP